MHVYRSLHSAVGHNGTSSEPCWTEFGQDKEMILNRKWPYLHQVKLLIFMDAWTELFDHTVNNTQLDCVYQHIRRISKRSLEESLEQTQIPFGLCKVYTL